MANAIMCNGCGKAAPNNYSNKDIFKSMFLTGFLDGRKVPLSVSVYSPNEEIDYCMTCWQKILKYIEIGRTE